MIKYKYLHVMFFDDVKFYIPLVKNINAYQSLNSNEHLFVTDKKDVYAEIKKFTNVKFVNSVALIMYMFKSEWIIFHSMTLKKWQFLLLPNNISKRIIWRTWGHDIRPYVKTERRIYDLAKRIEFDLFRKKLKKIFAFGVANEVDVVNIEEVYGSSFRYIKMPYTDSKANSEILKSIIPKSNGKITVLIGHNCSRVDNHLQILEELSKYKDENINLILPLSYSDPGDGYKEQVIQKAYSIFGADKVTILNDFISKPAYIQMIANIDIAIMDMYYSNGLGNISYILFFGKKLYIRKGGNLDKAFLREKINPNYTINIQNQDFGEFIKNDSDEKYKIFCDGLNNENSFEDRWKDIMKTCQEVAYEQ